MRVARLRALQTSAEACPLIEGCVQAVGRWCMGGKPSAKDGACGIMVVSQRRLKPPRPRPDVRFLGVIAKRTLSWSDGRKGAVEITFCRPQRDVHEGGDWVCRFQVQGLGSSRIRSAHGIDALQALLNAYEAVRVYLEPHLPRLAWDAGGPGDVGFVRMLPTFFGPAFSARLSRLVDSEIRRFVTRLKQKNAASKKEGSLREPLS